MKSLILLQIHGTIAPILGFLLLSANSVIYYISGNMNNSRIRKGMANFDGFPTLRTVDLVPCTFRVKCLYRFALHLLTCISTQNLTLSQSIRMPSCWTLMVTVTLLSLSRLQTRLSASPSNDFACRTIARLLLSSIMWTSVHLWLYCAKVFDGPISQSCHLRPDRETIQEALINDRVVDLGSVRAIVSDFHLFLDAMHEKT